VTTAFAPKTGAEVVEAVRLAVAQREPLIVQGSGTKSGWGRPVSADAVLDMSALAGFELYEPEELVLSARAGTSLVEIERRLAQQGQHLAFEPPDLGPLFGAPAGAATVGGILACNLAGPRRIQGGAARDHVLGFAGVNGLGESFKSGGRVVKNVTGFDLSKLLAGSFGTLAVMTEITFKVLPAPEMVRTILLFGLAPALAVDVLGSALRSPHEVSGAAHLPEAPAERSSVAQVARAHTSITAIRVEGTPSSVAARSQGLRGLLAGKADIAELDTAESRTLWREIRDVAPLLDRSAADVWHLSVPPAEGARVAQRIQGALDAEVYFDWGGGRVWLATRADAVRAAPAIRSAVGTAGGHATLVRASDASRRAVAPFQPPSAVEARLAERLKDNFDPHRILNPGRMYETV
jgi:glycolate oxidase FAD binding subunit